MAQDKKAPRVRRTRASRQTLRRLARTPLARELAGIANVLQSAKLHALAEKVAQVEQNAASLDRFIAEFQPSRDGKG